ncbi:urea ABC transporter permease subunit UrtB [Ketogulonicigenium vulgare]|uniref:Branched-chain amino acid ABC transporter, permease protein n=1 Tax=Ketogulonicigenium vulgare (strain WSH-001) TaxID=759362 RepID=F9Y4B2_KETVW|nr:urea ABC transporter permease subunit UrtB [Ketogulonicigenium vulgare]ADO43441.1 branched-chain amino acid ABC transporter, permease protein [Ketogulonicigenium vulgare Y25]AEM41725.1 Branched-chain amino acid ABC transporter, permease protein [Ketogulonicigenium vulgare WSH-001]ALJ81832.1 branched-chain amino acid ABC transporter permease [Ketogulonicigenium vulgare]ANW34489.1 urea ABC transporter permease subunit UrtB [Ketogulonicigenium vulgare]AOZ55478.1 branched-chain amino acid ABC t
MIRVLLIALALCFSFGAPKLVAAQTLQDALQVDPGAIAQPSRRTVGETLDRLLATEDPALPLLLERWQGRALYQRAADGLFFYAEQTADGFNLFDITTLEAAGTAAPREVAALIPNAGVRGVIASALIEFQLTDPDPARRASAVAAIARDPSADYLEPLRETLAEEDDPGLYARKERVLQMLIARFDTDIDARVAAISALGTDVSTETRALLNQLLRSTTAVGATVPEGVNIAAVLEPGSRALSRDAAYGMLISAGLAPAPVTPAQIREALIANIDGGFVGGMPVAQMNTDAARTSAYDALAASGTVAPRVTPADMDAALAAHSFWSQYETSNVQITDAAAAALASATTRVGLFQVADISLDALSLASIYFLAAIGLAITFGVMGVINMAHGEFIMMGAYTAYVVQLFIPDYTVALIVALPAAFLVAAIAGIALERLVIRHLANRPLETLLATFGISIALQQLTKIIFGTQARPVTAPSWLSGAWIYNDVLGISWIRIAIFVLALVFLALLLVILNRTRLGLEIRAVTQNPGMAASMGINPDRVKMLTFGLGSGIAGIAGVGIGLYAQVTSEMGSNYIVQSFMAVVVGGVGNVWGTLAGATLIGVMQKGIEWFNPSNTLAAQTYMILFIIIFIQFRPRGIVALKGRAAGV